MSHGDKPELPEAIEAAGRDVREIERRGARAPQAGRLLREVAENREVGVDMRELAKRKPVPSRLFCRLMRLLTRMRWSFR